MVLPGQYLERPTLIPRSPASETHPGVTLEGLYHRGTLAPGVVICAPHPRMGGSMDSPVVAELAWALTRAGHATLRFNYQGVGASGGDLHAPVSREGPQPTASLDLEAEDALAAIEQLRVSVEHGRVAVAGYSFGAAVALEVARRVAAVTAVIVVSPPTAMFDFTGVASLTQRVLVVAGHQDPWVDRAQMGEIVQNSLGRVSWEVVPHADHVFSQGLTELGRIASTWLDAAR